MDTMNKGKVNDMKGIKKIKCPKCRYTWDYKGNSQFYFSCPRCRANIRVKGGKHEKTN